MQTKGTSSDVSFVDNLRRLADQIRLELHLAGMEAKDGWEKLEPRLRELERKVEAAGGRIADDLSKAGAELETRMKALLQRLDQGKGKQDELEGSEGER